MTHPLKGRARPPVGAPTPRSLEVLRYLVTVQTWLGRAPTLREICEHFGWRAKGSAIAHLEALTGLGLVARPVKYRPGLRLTEAGKALAAKTERAQAIRAAAERRKEVADGRA